MMDKYKCFVKIKYRAGQVSHLLSLSLSLGGGHSIAVQIVFQRSDEVASVSRSQASSWSLMIWALWLETPQRDDPAQSSKITFLCRQPLNVLFTCLCTYCMFRAGLCVSVCYCMFRTGLYVSVHLLYVQNRTVCVCVLLYVQNRTVCVCVLLYVLSEKLLLGLDFSLPCILKCITFRYKTRCIHCMCA